MSAGRLRVLVLATAVSVACALFMIGAAVGRVTS